MMYTDQYMSHYHYYYLLLKFVIIISFLLHTKPIIIIAIIMIMTPSLLPSCGGICLQTVRSGCMMFLRRPFSDVLLKCVMYRHFHDNFENTTPGLPRSYAIKLICIVLCKLEICEKEGHLLVYWVGLFTLQLHGNCYQNVIAALFWWPFSPLVHH